MGHRGGARSIHMVANKIIAVGAISAKTRQNEQSCS